MHRDARLTPTGRRIMIEPIAAGPPQAHVAQQTSVSRATVSKWWRRRLAEGDAGLEDRSSRPRSCPTRTSKRVEQRVCRLRRSKRRGPPMIAMHTGVPASTVHEILVRCDLNRLARIDRLTGRVVRPTDAPVRASRSIPTSAKSPRSRPTAARGSAAAARSRTAGSAARTCPARSTTARGLPVSKPTTTNEPKRRSGSGLGPGTGYGPAP